MGCLWHNGFMKLRLNWGHHPLVTYGLLWQPMIFASAREVLLNLRTRVCLTRWMWKCLISLLPGIMVDSNSLAYFMNHILYNVCCPAQELFKLIFLREMIWFCFCRQRNGSALKITSYMKWCIIAIPCRTAARKTLHSNHILIEDHLLDISLCISAITNYVSYHLQLYKIPLASTAIAYMEN